MINQYSKDHSKLYKENIYKEIRNLFEFDENGILLPMAPGMAGPIGYMDMSKITIEGKQLEGMLFLSWSDSEVALIVTNKEKREATNEELEYALLHYKKAVKELQEKIILSYSEKGQEIPKYWQSRLGMIPYFSK